ncbi:hypothetical protein PFISCL1PPCAC_1239, partial [Pristionchus fissidentatus]
KSRPVGVVVVSNMMRGGSEPNGLIKGASTLSTSGSTWQHPVVSPGVTLQIPLVHSSDLMHTLLRSPHPSADVGSGIGKGSSSCGNAAAIEKNDNDNR